MSFKSSNNHPTASSDEGIRYVRESAIQRLIKYPHCCPSCHEDSNEYGYDMIELTDKELGKNRLATVCCEVANEFERWKEKGTRK